MPPTDVPGSGPEESGQASEAAGGQVHIELFEALVLLLIEKGVLTKNDVLSVIQTVAQVQQGRAVEGREPAGETQAALHVLRRMFASFEAILDGSGVHVAGGENVHQLRPPIYSDPPEFPQD